MEELKELYNLLNMSKAEFAEWYNANHDKKIEPGMEYPAQIGLAAGMVYVIMVAFENGGRNNGQVDNV